MPPIRIRCWLPPGTRLNHLLCLLAVVCLTLPTAVCAQDADDPAGNAPLLGDDNVNPNDTKALMNLDKELITAEDVIQMKRSQGAYSSALRTGDPKTSQKPLIEEQIRLHVLQLSLKENRPTLDQLRARILRDVKNLAGRNQVNPRLKRQFRELVLDEIIKNAKLLLDNNLQVRLQAVMLIASLNIVEEDRAAGVTAEPYEKALPTLEEVVADPAQDESIKIVALRGIRRIATDPQIRLSRDNRLKIAEMLVKELTPGDTYWWYQTTLIRSLLVLDIDVNRNQEPFIVQAMATAVADAKRDPRVRSEAASAVGRLPLSADVNLSLLAFQIASMTAQITEAYAENPGKVYWMNCYLLIYSAYQPLNDQEKANSKGLLLQAQTAAFAKHQESVQAAYGQVVGVINKVYANNRAGTPLPANTTAPLIDWLNDNKPADYRVAPALPPISTTTQNASTVSGTGR